MILSKVLSRGAKFNKIFKGVNITNNMSYKKIYFKTKDWKSFAKQATKFKPEVTQKTHNHQYHKIKKIVGLQENISKKYPRKYEFQYAVTKTREEFINECKKVYPKDSKANIIKRYYDIRKRIKDDVEETFKIVELAQKPIPKVKPEIVKPEIDFDDNNLIPINEVEQPSHIKIIQVQDMKRMGYKITDRFLQQYGYNRFEINWLRYNKVI